MFSSVDKYHHSVKNLISNKNVYLYCVKVHEAMFLTVNNNDGRGVSCLTWIIDKILIRWPSRPAANTTL